MKKSLYSLFAVLAIFCACQDENSQLGKSLVESSFYNVYADTCSVDISTILLDSIETRGDSICQLGHYRSSAWGEVSATYYAEYSTSDFTPNTDYTYTPLFKILNYELNSVTSEEYLFVRFFISSSLTP